ncbi:unnamed protein product [Macrosiphum euphorbiae]|nr:unnamed protein product [Macrosiphum euphorbiae]
MCTLKIVRNLLLMMPYNLYVLQRPIINDNNNVELQLESDDNLQIQLLQFIKIPPVILRLRKVEQLKAGTEKAKCKEKITLILIQTRTYGI